MNYRHIYHAGNRCDVVKHASLALLIESLLQKETAFTVLDTHAGIGAYDLQDERSQKTQEAMDGIVRLYDAFQSGHTETVAPLLKSYMAAIGEANVGRELRIYPGSPLLVRHMLRPCDSLMACELHPEDATDLRKLFRDDKQVHVHHRNGYEALNALLPFKTSRGLVLMDPPFEEKDEFDQLIKAVSVVRKKCAQAVVAMWYPIKDRAAVWRFHEDLIKTEAQKILIAEFIFEPEIRADRLNGTGLAILNTPWQFEAKLSTLYPFLHTALATQEKGVVLKYLGG